MSGASIDRDEPDLLVHSEIEVPDYFATIRTDTEQVLG
jgi:hypothetical protein